VKIAYVINSLEGGGAQSPIPCLFRVLESQGIDVKLYALSKRNGLSIPNLDAAKTLLKLTKPLSKLWVTDSEAVKELMIKRLGLEPEKTVIWPLFLSSSDAPQAKTLQKEEPIRIASLGRLHPNKGYDLLLHAIAKLKSHKTLPPFEINIAGQGAQKENLDALKQKLDVTEVNFVGHVTDPLTFLSAHLPILCCRVGQMAVTNQDAHSGWLCEPENIDSLAKSLDNLLSNRENLHLYGQKIRRTVLQDYSQAHFDEAGRDFIGHIRRCLINSPSPSVIVEGA